MTSDSFQILAKKISKSEEPKLGNDVVVVAVVGIVIVVVVVIGILVNMVVVVFSMNAFARS